MKNFVIALGLMAVLIAALSFLNEIIYLQIFSFVWIALYALGLGKLEGQFLDKKNELSASKVFWNGIVYRTLPLIVYIISMVASMRIEFRFSFLMFAIVAFAFIIGVFSELFKYIEFDDEEE